MSATIRSINDRSYGSLALRRNASKQGHDALRRSSRSNLVASVDQNRQCQEVIKNSQHSELAKKSLAELQSLRQGNIGCFRHYRMSATDSAKNWNALGKSKKADYQSLIARRNDIVISARGSLSVLARRHEGLRNQLNNLISNHNKIVGELKNEEHGLREQYRQLLNRRAEFIKRVSDLNSRKHHFNSQADRANHLVSQLRQRLPRPLRVTLGRALDSLRVQLSQARGPLIADFARFNSDHENWKGQISNLVALIRNLHNSQLGVSLLNIKAQISTQRNAILNLIRERNKIVSSANSEVEKLENRIKDIQEFWKNGKSNTNNVILGMMSNAKQHATNVNEISNVIVKRTQGIVMNSSRSADEAAMKAIRAINPTSVRENLEYGGWVCQLFLIKSRDQFFTTVPVKGTPNEVQIPANNNPLCTSIGIYHTHAGPTHRGSEEFSQIDMDIVNGGKLGVVLSRISERVRGILMRITPLVDTLRYNYVGTPCKAILKYDGVEKKVTILQHPDPACVASYVKE